MFENKTKKQSDFINTSINGDLGDVVEYANNLFNLAIKLKASDIHIEPTRTYVIIRFRESGDFIYVDKISHDEYAKLISRIKIMSNLRIDEKLKPQDGKIAYNSDGQFVDIRVSIIPVIYGEKVVMRVLVQDFSLLNLDRLNFLDNNLVKIKETLKSRYGMILVAGPTGSGKSTTLFSMLKNFDPLQYNITTLEDPVEYNIEHVNQTQIRKDFGLGFAEGLRSLVRQDPDIIMVGEIRDKETAMLAIEAALTGHLVLSTIHTNSAAGTIQRLINMGIEPFLITSALKLVVSQRLVKRLCDNCKKDYKLQDQFLMNKISGYIGDRVEEKVEDMIFSKGAGCEICDNAGYKGRLGIHEVLVVDEKIEPLILSKASDNEIEQKAKELGMITIMQDGLIKAATKQTTIDEVMKLI